MLTKPDTLQPREEPPWLDVIEGRKHQLALGYFMTKQPGQVDVDNKISYQAARQAEDDFFDNHEPWASCSEEVRQRMGTVKLGEALSKYLSELIDKLYVQGSRDESCSAYSPVSFYPGFRSFVSKSLNDAETSRSPSPSSQR